MFAGEMILEVAEGMKRAAWIVFAEAAERPVGPTRIVRKYRGEVRGPLLRRIELLGGERPDADHADLAVRPRLGRRPFDQVVAVPLARAGPIRLAKPARRADDV